MTEPLALKMGDLVTVSNDRQEIDARVFLASPNTQSLFLAFDGIFNGHVNAMPVLWHDGEYMDLMTGQSVTLHQPAEKES